MPITNITILPNPPTRDDPTNFAQRADEFLGALPVFVTELNTAADQIEIAESASESSADAAQTSAVNSALSAGTSAVVAGASVWLSGNAYAQYASSIDPVDFKTYRAKLAVTSATRPALDGTNWQVFSGQGDMTLDTAQTVSAVKTFTQPIVGSTNSQITKAGDTNIGSLTFLPSGVIGKEIMRFGPVSTNRMFITTFTNGSTHVGAGPNGTGTGSSFFAAGTPGFADEHIALRWNGTTGGSIVVSKDTEFNANPFRDFTIITSEIERFKINAAGNVTLNQGNVFIGATSYPTNVVSGVYVASGVSAGGFRSHAGTLGAFTADAWNLHWTGSAMQLWNGTTNLGTITLSSDYRIKSNVVAFDKQTAIGRVKLLKPVSYNLCINTELNFNPTDDQTKEGFIAHELAEVVPSAVIGEKDAPNQVQSLRLDPVVALLTSALQELIKEVEELKLKIEVLELK